MNSTIDSLDKIKDIIDDDSQFYNIISLLQNHHKFILHEVDIFNDNKTSDNDKLRLAPFFINFFTLHSKAEAETFYLEFKDSTNQDLRLEGYHATDEHEIANEIGEELTLLISKNEWTEVVNSKMRILTNLIKSHIRNEEKIMFPMAEMEIPSSKFESLAKNYIEKCKQQFDLLNETESNPSDVSRNDVMNFFY